MCESELAGVDSVKGAPSCTRNHIVFVGFRVRFGEARAYPYRSVAPADSTAVRVALATSSRKALRSGDGVTSGTGAARS